MSVIQIFSTMFSKQVVLFQYHKNMDAWREKGEQEGKKNWEEKTCLMGGS